MLFKQTAKDDIFPTKLLLFYSHIKKKNLQWPNVSDIEVSVKKFSFVFQYGLWKLANLYNAIDTLLYFIPNSNDHVHEREFISYSKKK